MFKERLAGDVFVRVRWRVLRVPIRRLSWRYDGLICNPGPGVAVARRPTAMASSSGASLCTVRLDSMTPGDVGESQTSTVRLAPAGTAKAVGSTVTEGGPVNPDTTSGSVPVLLTPSSRTEASPVVTVPKSRTSGESTIDGASVTTRVTGWFTTGRSGSLLSTVTVSS